MGAQNGRTGPPCVGGIREGGYAAHAASPGRPPSHVGQGQARRQAEQHDRADLVLDKASEAALQSLSSSYDEYKASTESQIIKLEVSPYNNLTVSK